MSISIVNSTPVLVLCPTACPTTLLCNVFVRNADIMKPEVVAKRFIIYLLPLPVFASCLILGEVQYFILVKLGFNNFESDANLCKTDRD